VTDAVQISIVTTSGGIIIALIGILLKKVSGVEKTAERVEINVNHRLDMLLEANEKLAQARVDGSFAAGLKEGRETHE
jgi:hypothetical protein